MEWIKIENIKNIPNVYDDVLFTDGYDVFKGYIVQEIDDESKIDWYSNGDYHIHNVTHWMPLPEPPGIWVDENE